MYKSFEEAEAEYYGLWYNENPNRDKAIEIAEFCYEKFEEHMDQIIMDLIVFYGTIGKDSEAKDMLKRGFDRENWYPEVFFSKFWSKAIYDEERKTWDALRKKAEESSKTKYQVISPYGYDKLKSYPLFISLHGWGENLEMFRHFWSSSIIEDEFIHLIIQSSQIIGSSHFTWLNRDKAVIDILEVVDEVNEDYLVSNEILIGGFSEGGTLAMDMSFSVKSLNAKGFISLNPNKPTNLTAYIIEKGISSNLSGCILTGDKDKSFEEQNKLAREFEQMNFNCMFKVKENFGHWFPDDLNERLNNGIRFIRNS